MLRAFATGPDLPLRDDVDVDRIYHRQRMRVILAITLAYAVSYTCRLAINVVKKPLIDGGIFTPLELGMIGSALFYTYAVGKLVNGFVADHSNVKRFFAVGLVLSALCNIAMGVSTVFWATLLIWGLNGWFQSYGAPSSVVALASWFSNRERGRYYGIWSTAHSIGEGLTFSGVAALVALGGWHWGFWGPGIATILAGIGAYLALSDRPRALGLPAVADWRNDHYAAAATETPERGVFATQLSILRIPAVWILALSSAATYVTRYAINSWGILYLQEERGYSLAAAGSMLTASTLAGIVGALSYGFISDKLFGARRPPANLLFGIVEIVGLLLLFYGPGDTLTTVLALILFGLGMTGLVTSLGGLFAIDICPKRVAGAALGFVGVFSYVAAAVQEQVSGALIDAGMRVVGDQRTYDFGPVITFWIGSSVVATLLAATLWRTRLRD
ncbi:MFS transporter [Sphingomonas sp.]|uniref:MFS transporter n=1 Tax=Sphingomonas sp. TaxID=28214 RepID=UPI002DD64AE0|nr:MFS transporter [Sphingomonas sp.]